LGALADCRITISHILYEGGKLTEGRRAFLDLEQPDSCIFGHMHQPKIEWFGKTLLFKPGSAGPKRFKIPPDLHILCLSGAEVKPRLISSADKVESHMVG
jgi:predicted phosphodiesterase